MEASQQLAEGEGFTEAVVRPALEHADAMVEVIQGTFWAHSTLARC